MNAFAYKPNPANRQQMFQFSGKVKYLKPILKELLDKEKADAGKQSA